MYRLEAIQGAVKTKKTAGRKSHLWLCQKEVRALMHTCMDDLTGKRDWLVLALPVGAGLRREEAVNLRFKDLTEVPRNGNGMRPVLDVQGKGAKDWVVPIKPLLAEKIKEWQELTGSDQNALILRSIGRDGIIGESLSAVGLFKIVRKHGELIDKPALAPHDLRRTYAQLGYEAGIPLTQITVLLGHSAVDVTM
jgi:integrase/recombinase XerD